MGYDQIPTYSQLLEIIVNFTVVFLSLYRQLCDLSVETGMKLNIGSLFSTKQL